MAVCFFNSSLGATVESQQKLHNLLPVSHEYGDKKSILEDGRELIGRQAHDEYAPSSLRMCNRKRCTLIDATATHVGTAKNRMPLKSDMSILITFMTTADWQAEGLDVECQYLKLSDVASGAGPRIGPYTFNFTAFVASIYEDLCMALVSMRTWAIQNGKKLHLKLVPLGVGPTIRTRFGDYLGPIVIPAYLVALQYACNAIVSCDWADTLEFVDHTGGQISPYISLRRVRIISASARDALDFAGCKAWPALLAPCDAFCRIGGGDKNLASTLAQNTNIREALLHVQFVPWTINECT